MNATATAGHLRNVTPGVDQRQGIARLQILEEVDVRIEVQDRRTQLVSFAKEPGQGIRVEWLPARGDRRSLSGRIRDRQQPPLAFIIDISELC